MTVGPSRVAAAPPAGNQRIRPRAKGSRNVCLTSVDAILMYQRCFGHFQGYSCFRHKWRRILKDPAITDAEQSLQAVVDDARRQCEEALVDAVALLKVHGVSELPDVGAVPLETNVFIASPLDGSYLDLIELFDHTSLVLETVESMKLCSSRDAARARGRLAHAVRWPLKAARSSTFKLRERFGAESALRQAEEHGGAIDIARPVSGGESATDVVE